MGIDDLIMLAKKRGVAALRTDRMVLIRLIANDFRTGMNG